MMTFLQTTRFLLYRCYFFLFILFIFIEFYHNVKQSHYGVRSYALHRRVKSLNIVADNLFILLIRNAYYVNDTVVL